MDQLKQTSLGKSQLLSMDSDIFIKGYLIFITSFSSSPKIHSVSH